MENRIKDYMSKSIGRRFTFSLTVFLVIPILIIFFLLNYFTREHMFDQACKVNFETLKQSKTAVTSFVKDIQFVSESILADDTVQNYLKLYNGTDFTDKVKKKLSLGYTLQSLMRSRDMISSVSVFKEDEILVQFGDHILEEDDEFLDEVVELKGGPVWTPAYTYGSPAFDDSRSKYVVSLMRVINDLYSLDRLGLERISTNEDDICALYSGICSEKGDMLIVNSSGEVVSATDKALLGNGNASLISRMVNKEGYYTDGDGVVSYYTIKNTGWYVVKRDPKEIFYAAYKENSLILILFLGLTILFGLVFKRSQEKTIIHPLKSLANDAEHFKEGNYSIGLQTTADDEIGQLNKTLISMGGYIERLIENEYKSKLYQKDIELKYMQAQINPHFLYNTLDSIRWMAVIKGEKEISEQIEALSDVFRHTLNYGRDMTTVGEELRNVDNYMKIQQNRFGERIKFKIDADKSLMDIPVPHLIMQPLVENALVHGLEAKPEGGTVTVRAYHEGDILLYIISDNGIGMDAMIKTKQLKSKASVHKIFALNNINERIKRRYSDDYGLQIESTIGLGTKVTVKMPIEGGENDGEQA